MRSNIKGRLKISAYIVLIILCTVFLWEVYIPKSWVSSQAIFYTLPRGMSTGEIAADLKERELINNGFLFRAYVFISGQHAKLQAGIYNLSSSMSVAEIARKFVLGDVVKNNITIIEGWNIKNISQYLESKNFSSQKDFLSLTERDWSQDFDFLEDKPKKLSLEGYIFPDTYEMYDGQTAKELLRNILLNFDKKITPDLRKEIGAQHKSVFQIITMASMLEKEVISLDDKKMVAGILWKRMESGMPLQVDATINYITNKNTTAIQARDKVIDSHYNTYKYYGLPKGPISNPGMDSILAAIYPKKSDYWYYLSADHTGETIFSKTLQEHSAAIAKYVKY